MIDTISLRRKILERALCGELTSDFVYDESVEDLEERIVQNRTLWIKQGLAKKEKNTSAIEICDTPFFIPSSWKWTRIGHLFQHNTGKALNSSNTEGELYEYITTSNLYWDRFELGELKSMLFKDRELEKCTVHKGDLLVCEGGDIGRAAIWQSDDEIKIQNHIHRLRPYCDICVRFYYYIFWYYKQIGRINGKGIGLQGLSTNTLYNLVVPLPPVDIQWHISNTIDEAFSVLDIIDELQAAYSFDLEVLKSKVIDAGIQGKLTEQLPEDGNAEDLYADIQEEIDEDEKDLAIPDNWQWIKLGWAMDIERGGSPRPIKAFMTDSEDGINWIKIGDVAKDGKYITQTKERITPEGEKKSRKVAPGDFLLTNSMSFGRPYISKIYGCIHDGWLLLRNSKESFDLDYLYCLLSSKYVYDQFCKKASGATVDNLNKEKVASAVIPLPPISEQTRIAEVIGKTLSMIY